MNKDDLQNCFKNTHNSIRYLWYLLQSRVSAYKNLEAFEAIISSNYIHERALLDVVETMLRDMDNLNGHVEFIPDVWEKDE